MTDQTGLTEFIQKMIAQDRAWVAELPDQIRTRMERSLRIFEYWLEIHGPDPRLVIGVNQEPLCVGCVEDVAWPCDDMLHLASLWREEPEFRSEWRDAINPLAHAEGF